jgi:hypothetical protein
MSNPSATMPRVVVITRSINDHSRLARSSRIARSRSAECRLSSVAPRDAGQPNSTTTRFCVSRIIVTACTAAARSEGITTPRAPRHPTSASGGRGLDDITRPVRGGGLLRDE